MNPHPRSQMQVIYKPRLVRAEWGSIEAMSGADDEETAGGAQILGGLKSQDMRDLCPFCWGK